MANFHFLETKDPNFDSVYVMEDGTEIAFQDHFLSLTSLEDRVSDLETDKDNLEWDNKDLKSQISTLESKVSSLEDKLSASEKEEDYLRRRIREMEQELESLAKN